MNPNKISTPNYKKNKIRLPVSPPLIFNRRFTNSKANSYFSLPGNDLGPLYLKSDLLTIRSRVFQIGLMGGRGMGNFAGKDFLLGGWILRRSDFKHSNIFQSKKQLSVNT